MNGPGPARHAYAWHDCADSATLAARSAAAVARCLAQGLAERNAASLIVSGGRTPGHFFAVLAKTDLAWERVTISLADERWAPASVESNEQLVRTHLLTGAAAKARFLPLKTEAKDPAAALSERMRALQAMRRPVDAVVLGMGEDGHTASLFPGATGLAEALDPFAAPALVAITPPAAAHRRISLNLAALLDARRLFLLLQSAAKRTAFERAVQGNILPIAAVVHQSQAPVDVYWAA